jgi:hypothetical protein
MQLDRDLIEAVHAGNEAALQLQARHHNGEFDASTEESDDWAESPTARPSSPWWRRTSRGDRRGKFFQAD